MAVQGDEGGREGGTRFSLAGVLTRKGRLTWKSGQHGDTSEQELFPVQIRDCG